MDKTLALAPNRVALYGYAHVPWMKRHQNLIDAGRFAIALGVEKTDEDRQAQRIIKQLMCHMEVDLDAVGGPHSKGRERFASAIADLAPLEACGAIHLQGARITVAPEARLLLRVICAAFDCRLATADRTSPRHATTV